MLAILLASRKIKKWRKANLREDENRIAMHVSNLLAEMLAKKNDAVRKNRIIPTFLARLAGFEPATYRFVAGHSIH